MHNFCSNFESGRLVQTSVQYIVIPKLPLIFREMKGLTSTFLQPESRLNFHAKEISQSDFQTKSLFSDFLNYLHNKHIRSGFDDKLQRQHGQLHHHKPRQFRHYNSEHSRGLIKCHFRATIPSGNLQCYRHSDDSRT